MYPVYFNSKLGQISGLPGIWHLPAPGGPLYLSPLEGPAATNCSCDFCLPGPLSRGGGPPLCWVGDTGLFQGHHSALQGGYRRLSCVHSFCKRGDVCLHPLDDPVVCLFHPKYQGLNVLSRRQSLQQRLDIVIHSIAPSGVRSATSVGSGWKSAGVPESGFDQEEVGGISLCGMVCVLRLGTRGAWGASVLLLEIQLDLAL